MGWTSMIAKVPTKYRDRVESVEKWPEDAGGAKYRLELKKGWVHYEGSHVLNEDNFNDILWAIKTSKKEDTTMTFCELNKQHGGCPECPNRYVCKNSTIPKEESAAPTPKVTLDEYAMRYLQEEIGMTPEQIATYTASELFEATLNYEGYINAAGLIKRWVKRYYGIDLDE